MAYRTTSGLPPDLHDRVAESERVIRLLLSRTQHPGPDFHRCHEMLELAREHRASVRRLTDFYVPTRSPALGLPDGVAGL